MKSYLRLAGAVALLVALVGIPITWAAGLWGGLPVFGTGSYCAGNITTLPGGTVACSSTVPAGPTVFLGSEVVPVDIYNPSGTAVQTSPSTMLVNLTSLNQVPVVINTTAGPITIPNNTSTFVENVGNTSITVTLPLVPTSGEIVKIPVATAQTTSFLIGVGATPTGVSCLPACPYSAPITAGSSTAWQYNGPTNQWLKIQ
jgi:hypothetical protein